MHHAARSPDAFSLFIGSPRLRAWLACLISFGCVGVCAAGQDEPPYRCNIGAILSEDADAVRTLEESLGGFFDAIARGEITDDHVSSEHQARHPFFMRALRAVRTRPGAEPNEPLLLKAYSPDAETYLVTAAFMRPSESGDEIYKIFEFHAYPNAGGYRFKSPFEHRTRSMRSRQVGSVRYRFDNGLNTERAEAFAVFKERLEGMIGAPAEPLDYYRFDSLDRLLMAHGVVYDATKCNWLNHDLGFVNDDGSVYATGTGDERYIFEFAKGLIARHCDQGEQLYPPFVTGIAVYFGDYALSGDDMPTLKAQFRAELARNPDINFLDEFRKGRGASINRHFTFFVISAFIAEEIIERHGFDAALGLARSGRSGERFFELLDAALGVDESGFHDLVLRLIGA